MPPVAAIFTFIGMTGVAAAISSAWVAVTTWAAAHAFLANMIGSMLISVGISLVQSIFMKNRGADMQASKINVRLGEPPRWLASGQMRQGGGCLFAEFDKDGNLWYLIVHSDSILIENTYYMLDEEIVTVDEDGWVTSNAFILTPDGMLGSLLNPISGALQYFRLWTTTYTESDPTPPGILALQTAFPTKWTANHKLVGTTYTVCMIRSIKQELRHKIYRWRGPLGLGEPSISIVGKWSNAYDPRDETQTKGVPSTYKYGNANPVLTWAWFRTHRYGRRKSVDSINWEKVAEQAAICDQIVVDAWGGSHTRYACSTAVPENKERAIAEQEILASMDAQLVFDDDGKCWPRVGYYETPTLKLTRNRDIVAMESVEANNGESETQGVIVRYIDPASNYAVQPSAAWLNPLYYVEGEAATFLTVDVLTCQDHNQAMRIAKAVGMRSQSAHKCLPTTTLRGLRARKERIVDIIYDNTFAGDYEIVTPVEVNDAGIFCGFGIVPVDEDRWTLLPGEERSAPTATIPPYVGEPDVPEQLTGVVVTRVGNHIEATWDAPLREDVTADFEFVNVGNLALGTWFKMDVQPVDRLAISAPVQPYDTIYVRWRALSPSTISSDWIDPLYELPGETIVLDGGLIT
jgi:hypothetical protein